MTPRLVERAAVMSGSRGSPKYMKAPFLSLGARKGAFMYFEKERGTFALG